MDFVVNTPILVVGLGVFDDESNGLNRDLGVRIWSRDTGGTADFADDTALAVLGETTFTSVDAGTLVGGSRFKSVLPFVLPPGDYTVGGWGFGASERNGNVGTGSVESPIDDGGGAITFVGGSRFGDPATPGSFPASVDGGPPNRYDSGTFEFDVVPEPSAAGLVSLGALLLFARRRRR